MTSWTGKIQIDGTLEQYVTIDELERADWHARPTTPGETERADTAVRPETQPLIVIVLDEGPRTGQEARAYEAGPEEFAQGIWWVGAEPFPPLYT